MKLISRSLTKIKHKLRKTSKVILAGLLICLVVRLLPYFAPLRAADIAQNQLAMQFSDRNGLPLGTLLTRDQEHTSVVPLNQVSPQFIHAILAAEDGSFYERGVGYESSCPRQQRSHPCQKNCFRCFHNYHAIGADVRSCPSQLLW
ncbi:hypothetical protein [Nostoc sp.]|uniref:hypothetical protein n=1 Tax=Nostoc sp. TaxID=1180 RepID=UPI003FA5CC2C